MFWPRHIRSLKETSFSTIVFFIYFYLGGGVKILLLIENMMFKKYILLIRYQTINRENVCLHHVIPVP